MILIASCLVGVISHLARRLFCASFLTALVVVVAGSSSLAAVSHGFVKIRNDGRMLLAREMSNAEAVRFVAFNALDGAQVIMNFRRRGQALEYFFEFECHLHLFHDRADLHVSELCLAGGSWYSPGDLLLVWSAICKYPPDEVLEYFGESLEPADEIAYGYTANNLDMRSCLHSLSAGREGRGGEYLWEIYRITGR